MKDERPDPVNGSAGGGRDASAADRLRRLVLAGSLVTGLTVAACAEETEHSINSTTSTPTSDDEGDGQDRDVEGDAAASPSCGDQRHLVFISLDDVVTEPGGLDRWQEDDTYDLLPMPGARELMTAYHERGFEVVYITESAADAPVRDMTYGEAVGWWLGANDLPVGERTALLLEASAPRLVHEMITAEAGGGSTYAAYLHDPDLVATFAAGGVPRDRIYVFGEATGAEGTPAVPADGIEGLLPTVEGVRPVCGRTG